MSKKKSKKQKEAETVKIDRPEKKETKVDGSAKFENGKLVKPTATQELMEMQKKKEQLKAQEPGTLDEAKKLIDALRAKLKGTIAPKLEDLPDDESKIKYFNFCQVQKYRDEMKYILEQVEQIPGIEIRHNAYAECYRINNKLVGELFPLKRQWSARVHPGVVKRWDTPDEYLEELRARIEKVRAEVPAKAEQKPAPIKSKKEEKVGEEAVAILKDKIKGLSKSSKGFAVPATVKLTDPEVKAWIKQNGYSATGNSIMLNRVP